MLIKNIKNTKNKIPIPINPVGLLKVRPNNTIIVNQKIVLIAGESRPNKFLIRKNNELSINELETFRKKNQTIIKDKIYESNSNLVDSLPSYDNIVDFTNDLLKTEKYVQYVINYLLINCQVRNADLIFDFVLFNYDKITHFCVIFIFLY